LPFKLFRSFVFFWQIIPRYSKERKHGIVLDYGCENAQCTCTYNLWLILNSIFLLRSSVNSWVNLKASELQCCNQAHSVSIV
jgi:hypothetical protein